MCPACCVCSVLDTLLSSGTFLEGACHFLAKLWDQEVEVVAAKLTERGWDQHTGAQQHSTARQDMV